MNAEKTKSPMLELLTSRTFWIAFLIQVVYTIGNVFVKQTVTLQANSLGMSASVIGVIASCYTIMAMVCRTPFGQAMDRFDKKRVLMITFVARAFVFVGLGVTTSVPVFVALRFFHGALFGMGHIAMMIVLAAGGNRKALGAALGLLTLLPKLISSYTTTFALFICDSIGTNAACYAGAVCSLLCVGLCLFLEFKPGPAKTPAPSKGLASGLKNYMNWRAVPLILICTLVSVPSLFVDNFMVLYGAAVPAVETAARSYLTSYMWWMGVGAFAAGYAFDKFGFRVCAYPTIIMGIAAQAMLGFSTDIMILRISAILCGLACGSISVVVRTHAVNESPVSVAALTIATTGLFQDLSSLLGSGCGGFLIEALDYSGTFKLITIFPVIALVMMFFYPAIMKCLKGQAPDTQPAEP